MKKAFTLIELLVVIAIIAILAAILFPVFAQAKLAAKKTVSLSNLKQIGTAAFIYMGDSDDAFPKAFYGFPTSDQGPWGSVYYNWRYVINPYTKSKDLLSDPTNPYQGKTGKALGMRRMFEDGNPANNQYSSMNYATNTNLIGFANGHIQGLPEGIASNTNLDDVAGTIMLLSNRTRWTDIRFFYLSPKYDGYNGWCLTNDPDDATNASGLVCPAAGNGGIHAIAKQAPFAFADGHAKTQNVMSTLQLSNPTFDNWYAYGTNDPNTNKPYTKDVLKDVAANAYPEYK